MMVRFIKEVIKECKRVSEAYRIVRIREQPGLFDDLVFPDPPPIEEKHRFTGPIWVIPLDTKPEDSCRTSTTTTGTGDDIELN